MDLAECSLQLRAEDFFLRSVAFLETKQSNSHHSSISPFNNVTDEPRSRLSNVLKNR